MKRISVLAIIATFFVLLFSGCSSVDATLSETQLALTTGVTHTLELTLSSEAEVVWQSSDESVATVEVDGNKAVVTAVGEGTAKITVSYKEKELASCDVTVEASPLYIFLPENLLVLRRNATATVKAYCLEEVQGEPVWSSSDEAVGTVKSQGLIAIVTAVKKGDCTITVQVDGYVASFTLTVGT